VKLIPFKGIAKLLPGKLIRESCITHWHSVPSAFRALQNRRELTPETLSSFKTVVFCGETLYVDLAKEILKCNPNIALWNTYGPTEATVFCSALHVTEEKINSFKGPSVSIGQPIDTMYFSLGANTSEGELVLVGENVAKGYINDSDRNKFDSFSVNGKNYPSYRSGDYVRVSGGEYFFICRIDNQVKIRGNRFDMDEITYALQKIGCHGVVSIEQEGEIFTFVCSKNSDCPMSESEMQQYLRDKLPTYGVPYRIMLVDSFPLNTNGKIDKRELTRFIEGGV
jgi:D-alanine--poly(phosphoribitol) ligase subunit 1